eukprot:TRINITY_DN1065_c0_g2_i2.p1 TRINITY_DN1065_c0_g2~~TRINITY_DN1065_c0_g2_i2.p1  ORF type:complete len:799 (+),score=100.57 TRINITY_DN1065_c0_g2_i2:60-2456(+)
METKAGLLLVLVTSAAGVVLDPLPFTIARGTAETVSDTVFLIGGCKDADRGTTTITPCTAFQDSIMEYNTSTAAHASTMVSLSTPREDHATVVVDNVIYMMGGVSGTTGLVAATKVESFTPGTGVREDVTDLPSTMSHLNAGAFAFGKKIYYCSGTSAKCAIYDIDTKAWMPKTIPFPERSGFRVVVNTEGTSAYVVGGADITVPASPAYGSDIYILSAGSEEWQTRTLPFFEFNREDAVVVLLNEVIYVLGGAQKKQPLQTALAVYPLTNEVQVIGGLDVSLMSTAAATHNDAVFMFGGLDANLASTTASNRFEIKPQLLDLPTIPLHGSGTTNPSRFFWKWMEILTSRIKVPTHITYRAVGSSTGMSDLRGVGPSLSPVVSFACGDIPLKKEIYDEMNAASRTVVHVPFALGTISVFVNLPVTSPLKLTPCVLAKIYTGAIKEWDHADILAHNSQHQAVLTGRLIQVGRRKHGSSSTFGLTQYMADGCRSVWNTGPNSKIALSDAHVSVREGSTEMTQFLESTEYAIGYLDSGHGIAKGLKEAALEGQPGSFGVSSNADIAKAADGASWPEPTADWSSFSLINRPGAWPITMVSYFYLYQDMTGSGITGSLLKAFVETVLSAEGQQDMETNYGFKQAPSQMKAVSEKALNSLWMPVGAPIFTYERETQKNGVGMGDYVISTKRNPRPFDSAVLGTELDQLREKSEQDTVQIKQLQDMIESLKSKVDTLQQQRGTDAAHDHDDDNVKMVAILALVVGTLAALVAVAGIWFTQSRTAGKKGRNLPAGTEMSEPDFQQS